MPTTLQTAMSGYNSMITSIFINAAAKAFSNSVPTGYEIKADLIIDGVVTDTKTTVGSFNEVQSQLRQLLNGAVSVVGQSGYTFSVSFTAFHGSAMGLIYYNFSSGQFCAGYSVGASSTPANAGWNLGMLIGGNADYVDSSVSGLGTTVTAEAEWVGWQVVASPSSGKVVGGPTLGQNALPAISGGVGSATCAKFP
jgi:hypothetical protein